MTTPPCSWSGGLPRIRCGTSSCRSGSIRRSLRAAATALGRGYNVLIFPEGTRSREGKLLPFARTPFEIACRAGVPTPGYTKPDTPPT